MSLLSILKESVTTKLAYGVINNTLPLYAIISGEKTVEDKNGVPISNGPANLQRTSGLRNQLISNEYKFTPVEGKYKFQFEDESRQAKEVIENSFIVYPKSGEDAESFETNMAFLAKKYGQESVLLRDVNNALPFRFKFTNGKTDSGIGTRMVIVDDIENAEFYTKIGNNHYQVI